MTIAYRLRGRAFGLLASLLLLLSGCASPPPPPAEKPLAVLDFDQAATQLADRLLAQVLALKPVSGGRPRRLVFDPMIESASGQQTAATAMLQKRIADRLASQPSRLTLMPFDASNLGSADGLLAGTISAETGASTGRLSLDVTLIDLPSGMVIAHASAPALGAGVDHTPSPYYRDSPIRVKDAAIDGYVRSASTPVGEPANPAYLGRLTVASLIDEGMRLYNAGRYEEAIARYQAASRLPAGQQLRVYNGLYLGYTKLGRNAEAELAFGDVVAAGIRYKELSLKLLFAPGRTDFWADPRVSGAYPMWLRQIARASESSKTCMVIVGHTSATGTAELNGSLSLQRANVVRQRMLRESAELAPRVKAIGVGSAENIVGSGTDDGGDALDRRVEFRIFTCG